MADSLVRMRARHAIETRWAHEPDRTRATAPARRAFESRFAREVDPDGRLRPEERRKRAESARKAYFTKLALRSAQARRKAAKPAVRVFVKRLKSGGTLWKLYRSG